MSDTIEYYGGDGFMSCPRRDGLDYRIKWHDEQGYAEITFDNFDKAYEAYSLIVGAKAFWCEYELIDCWTWKDGHEPPSVQCEEDWYYEKLANEDADFDRWLEQNS